MRLILDNILFLAHYSQNVFQRMFDPWISLGQGGKISLGIATYYNLFLEIQNVH